MSLFFSNCCISVVENSSDYIEKSVKQHPQSRPTHTTYSVSVLIVWVVKNGNHNHPSFLSRVLLFGTTPHTHYGVAVRWLRSLPPAYPPVSSPLVSVHSRFHPSNLTCHGPFKSFTRRLYLCPLPSFSITIIGDLVSSLLLPSPLRCCSFDLGGEISSHHSQKAYQNVNDDW